MSTSHPSGKATTQAAREAHQPGLLAAYGVRARSYNRDTGMFHRYRRAVVEALPLRRGQLVLDVGCGTGLCTGFLRDKVGPQGGVVGIEESPEMAAVAREQIACERWRNVTVVQSPAEHAELGLTADAALFCAVHDILQSPGALRNVLARLRPGGWVAAGGAKWAAPVLVGLNALVGASHAPYVRSFRGFDKPWRHLEQLTDDVHVQEVWFGSGYIMTGRIPAQPGRPA